MTPKRNKRWQKSVWNWFSQKPASTRQPLKFVWPCCRAHHCTNRSNPFIRMALFVSLNSINASLPSTTILFHTITKMCTNSTTTWTSTGSISTSYSLIHRSCRRNAFKAPGNWWTKSEKKTPKSCCVRVKWSPIGRKSSYISTNVIIIRNMNGTLPTNFGPTLISSWTKCLGNKRRCSTWNDWMANTCRAYTMWLMQKANAHGFELIIFFLFFSLFVCKWHSNNLIIVN